MKLTSDNRASRFLEPQSVSIKRSLLRSVFSFIDIFQRRQFFLKCVFSSSWQFISFMLCNFFSLSEKKNICRIIPLSLFHSFLAERNKEQTKFSTILRDDDDLISAKFILNEKKKEKNFFVVVFCGRRNSRIDSESTSAKIARTRKMSSLKRRPPSIYQAFEATKCISFPVRNRRCFNSFYQ